MKKPRDGVAELHHNLWGYGTSLARLGLVFGFRYLSLFWNWIASNPNLANFALADADPM